MDREGNIQRYLNGDMSDSEMATFEEHFLNCYDCIEELRDSLQLIEFVQNEGNHLFPEFSEAHEKKPGSYLDKIIKKYFGPGWYLQPSLGFAFAAALILVVMIYVLNPAIKEDIGSQVNDKIVFSKDNTETQADNIVTDDPADEVLSKDNKADLYAANFIESDDLEFIIDQRYRGSESINVLSPETGITIKDEILFNWVTDAGQQLYLKILNNEEDVLFQFTPLKNNLLFNIAENKLDPGLYYWKLKNDEELLHIGKFLIKE